MWLRRVAAYDLGLLPRLAGFVLDAFAALAPAAAGPLKNPSIPSSTS